MLIVRMFRALVLWMGWAFFFRTPMSLGRMRRRHMRFGMWSRSRRRMHIAISLDRMLNEGLLRTPMVHRFELRMIHSRGFPVLPLRRHHRSTRLANGDQLLGLRPCMDPGRASVIADPINNRCPIDNLVVVHVMDHSPVDVIDGAVIEKVATVPVSAVIAHADIAEAVVHAAVEPDVVAPVSGVQ